MYQVIQPIDGRNTEVVEIPTPGCGPNQVLIANACSLISVGTEKGVVELARKSLLAKARQRPDHVRRVLQKVRQEGLASTVRQVRAKLDQPMPLGYSSAGVVLEVGPGVERFRPGDRVASNGGHAGIVAVGENLVAHVPDGVPFDEACYAVVGSIAMQGVRLARIEIGSVVAVIGLGLIGQITVALLRAAGCIVLGTDLDAEKCRLAAQMGVDWAAPGGLEEAVMARTRGFGADAVLITASTASNAPLELAAKLARPKGRVVAVGAVGMDVPRRDFYPKELELVVSCSYGPGRYDPEYEDAGRDYPYPYVRWTEQRNIQSVLDLMGQGRLSVAPLTTHRYPIERAVEAYGMIAGGSEPAVGVVLTFPESTAPASPRRIAVPPPPAARPARPTGSKLGVGFVGVGNFATAMLLPALAQQEGIALQGICSARGLSARTQAGKYGFANACTDAGEIFRDPKVDVTFIATRHDSHASLLLEALAAGKHVYLEKPLALTEAEMGQIEAFLAQAGGSCPIWTVGFNRRFAPASQAVRQHFAAVDGPRTATYRFNAGDLPQDHWAHDERVGGGRIIGEACHAVDLLSYLIGSPVTGVSAESVAAGSGLRVASDRAVITLRHADGSVSSILYTAGGDRAASKERVEVFGGGRVGIIDDFSQVELFRGGKATTQRWSGQSKGHKESVAAFLGAVRSGGPPPIPLADLLATSYAVIGAMESMRSGARVDLILDQPAS